MSEFFQRRRVYRWLREIVVLLVLAAVLMWGVDRFRSPTLPDSFSGMAVQTLDGQNIDLAALSDTRPLLIYVWATWCSVCRYTTPSVEKLAAQGENVVSIALRSGDDTRLAQWMQKKQLTMPVVNDARGELAQRWQVSVTPTIVIVSQGQPVSVTTGWTSYWGMKARLWAGQ